MIYGGREVRGPRQMRVPEPPKLQALTFGRIRFSKFAFIHL